MILAGNSARQPERIDKTIPAAKDLFGGRIRREDAPLIREQKDRHV